jgi:Bromodomain
MNTLTAYTPLESLLLFQSLAKYGAEPPAFSTISDLLKGNPLVRQAKTFDTGRLSPDALRELYLSLLKEEAGSEIGRNGSLEQPGDEGQSNSRKRKLQAPDVAQQAQQLVKRLYARYIENITRLIREDERRYQGLRREVEEIRQGELVEELRKRETSEPPANALGDGEPTARQNASEVPSSIGEPDAPVDKGAETTPAPAQINAGGITEDVNGTIRDGSPKSAAPEISRNASPTPPVPIASPGTAVESLPSPSAPAASLSDQAATIIEEQGSSIARLSSRSRTPQAQTPVRPQSAEPRTSGYSRHYVTSTPAAQLNDSSYLRIPNQPELAECLSPDLANGNDTSPIPTLQSDSRVGERPQTSSKDQSNILPSQQTQIPRLHEQDALGSAPSPTADQPPAEVEAAATVAAESVLSSEVQDQTPEQSGPTDVADGQHQVGPTTGPGQDGPLVSTPEPMECSTPPRTPVPPLQDTSHPSFNNVSLQNSELIPNHPRTPLSIPQAQIHQQPATYYQALESTPSELGKLSPQDQSLSTKQGEAQKITSDQIPGTEAMQQLPLRSPLFQTPTPNTNVRQNLFITPGFSKPRPPPIDTSALSNRSFKPFDRGLISGSPGSPVRPGPDEISPISAPSSPILFPKPLEYEPPSIAKDKEKAQGDASLDVTGRVEEGDTDELETRKTRSGRTQNFNSAKSRKTRAESTASSAVPPSARARSRSIVSHADELSMDHETISRLRVKHEPPPTPSRTSSAAGADKGGGEATIDEGTRPRRGKRKEPEDVEEMGPKPKRIGTILGAHDTHSTLQPTADNATAPQYVLSTRNFARTSATIMNDIGQHKYASIFSSPVKEKDAPGYKDLIYRPQDLKSIKSAIAAGGKAVAAAIGAVSVSGGTPTENSPSPGPVGTAAAKNTSLWIPISQEVVPPRGIINSAQLEKELMRMFANAVMFNPGPDRGFGPAFKEKAESGQEEDEDTAEEDEDGGVVKDTREMFAVVERAVTDWRAAERAVESLSGKPPATGTGLGRPKPGVMGKEKEEDEPDEAPTASTAAVTADDRTEDKEDREASMGPARKRRRL